MSCAQTLLHEETLPGGGHWSWTLKRGRCLRLTDLEGGANVALLAFNAQEKSERLNLPDTLKCQHTARLTKGHCLYSDMGRVLLAIVADDCGWHDAIGGVSDAADVQAQFGDGGYQALRNGFHRNGRDNLLVELGKWGLARHDQVMNLNLFSRLDARADGALEFAPGHSKAGDAVTLYAPMDVLVVLTAIQHPLDPDPVYAPKPVRLEILRPAEPDTLIEPCRNARPENARGFTLTERLFV